MVYIVHFNFKVTVDYDHLQQSMILLKTKILQATKKQISEQLIIVIIYCI